jgi:hypothetical protein
MHDTLEKPLSVSGSAIAVFVIPIAFSFIFGGAVLALSLQDHSRGFEFGGTPSSSSIQIIGLQSEYSSSDSINVQVSVSDPAYSCGNLSMTIYDVSSAKTAVKQNAFFEQCYDASGTLPIGDKFSEKLDAGKYSLEVQMFDKNGDKYLTASQKFTVS